MTTLKQYLGLTEAQWDILSHRLEMPDAIAEAITEDYPDDGDPYHPYSFSQIEETADMLQRGGDVGMFDPELVKLIVEDCIDGSTYMASMDDVPEVSPQRAASIRRSAEAVERAAKRVFGIDAVFPQS